MSVFLLSYRCLRTIAGATIFVAAQEQSFQSWPFWGRTHKSNLLIQILRVECLHDCETWHLGSFNSTLPPKPARCHCVRQWRDKAKSESRRSTEVAQCSRTWKAKKRHLPSKAKSFQLPLCCGLYLHGRDSVLHRSGGQESCQKAKRMRAGTQSQSTSASASSALWWADLQTI